MASPLNLGQVADATNLAIQKIFKKDAEIDMQFKKYYNFRTTEDYIEKDSSLSGLKEAEFTTENAEMLEDVPVQGYDQTYTQQQVHVMYPMSYMTWKFAIKKRNLENISQEINRSLSRKKEKLASERITNGFNTTYAHSGVGKSTTITVTGGDGLEPWSTAHTSERGGSNMNNVIYDGTTYSLPFDYSGYKAAIRTASLFVDPRGNPDPARLDTLVCKTGSSVHMKAMEILGAIKKGQIPESNDNVGVPAPSLSFDSVNIVAKTREMQFTGHTLFQQGHNDVTRTWVFSAGDSTTS